MLSTFVSLGIVGVVTIGGTLLEGRLIKDGKTGEGKIVGDCLYHGTRIGCLCFIGYSLMKVVVWFL